VIAHLVLFRPRAALPAEARARLGVVFASAVRSIPSVRRARVGRRVLHGRGYEALMQTHYSHVAMLEFDDEAGLKAYLEHPAHEQLGGLFFEAFEEGLIYDFTLEEGDAAISALAAG
jgi:hypothetical protein